MTSQTLRIGAAKAALGLSPGGGIPVLVRDLSRIHPGSAILRRLANDLGSQTADALPSPDDDLVKWPTPREAVIVLSKQIARQIIDGTLAPLDGAEVIHAISTQAWQDYPELGTFLFAALEAAGRPEDREKFENAIVEEARELLQD